MNLVDRILTPARVTLAATAQTIARRIQRGSARPSWSFTFELAVGLLREQL